MSAYIGWAQCDLCSAGNRPAPETRTWRMDGLALCERHYTEQNNGTPPVRPSHRITEPIALPPAEDFDIE